MAAVRRAAPHVDAVEVDVRRCGTGEVVVFHDGTLDRVTDASGRVDETPLSRLRSLRVGGPDADGDDAAAVAIPTLADLVAAVPPDVAVNVELKHGGMADRIAEVAAAAENEVWASSFDRAALAEVRKAAAGLDRAPLFVGDEGWDEALAWASDVGAAALHPAHESVTDERVARAHDAGLAVNAWTVRSPPVADRCRQAGVDGLILDSWTVA